MCSGIVSSRRARPCLHPRNPQSLPSRATPVSEPQSVPPDETGASDHADGEKRMWSFVLGDHPSLVTKARQVLLREGQDCPEGNVLPLSLAVQGVRNQSPELLVVVLNPDPEQALTVLA